MNYCVEIKAEQGIDIVPGNYFSTAALADDCIIAGSEGMDEFQLHSILLPGKCAAGLGRKKSYSLDSLPNGLSALEAAPAENFYLNDTQHLAIKVTTNIFLDQGLFTHYLTLRVAKNFGPFVDISLLRPDVVIDWIGRGVFIIQLDLLGK
jgi:hypothetical protein